MIGPAVFAFQPSGGTAVQQPFAVRLLTLNWLIGRLCDVLGADRERLIQCVECVSHDCIFELLDSPIGVAIFGQILATMIDCTNASPVVPTIH